MPTLILTESEQQIAIKPLALPKKRDIHLAYKDFDILPIDARKFIRFIQNS